ncbi:MAG: hypothetical protein K8F28_05230, partial [Ignavibacteriaceae bacterium]|nr:hypothetical protein [Ignavibacteriaceae bacterium]
MNEPIPIKEMKKKLDENFPLLLKETFGILESENLTLGGMRVVQDNKKEIKELKDKVKNVEDEIEADIKECRYHFSDENLIAMEEDLDAFKNNVFGEKLWTVRSSLRDMSNPELERYRDSFDNATPREIYVCVKEILNKSKEYVKEKFTKIDMRRVLKIEDLQLDYLDDEDLLLSGVIGLGIRSELLYRMYPKVFPIMTRRSLWGMYFFTNADEFIIDENKDGRSRTSHQWNYEYPRFCFYANHLTLLLEKKFQNYKIQMNQDLRYGYLNFMLVEYAKTKKKEIEKLYTWEYT